MIALGLLTASAGCHAAWNLLLKRSGLGGPAFVWLCGVLTLPVALVLLCRAGASWWAAVVSMALHTTYAVVLQRAYGVAEFSAVYPVSRGTAPVLVTAVVAPLEPLVVAGAVLTFVGVLAMDRMSARSVRRGVGPGLVVGACSAAYTVWDGFAVTSLRVDLLGYLAVANVAQVVVLGPLAWRRREVVREWRRALPIAALMPAAYGLVLLALTVTSVEVVAVGRTLKRRRRRVGGCGGPAGAPAGGRAGRDRGRRLAGGIGELNERPGVSARGDERPGDVGPLHTVVRVRGLPSPHTHPAGPRCSPAPPPVPTE
ncbi:EamA family transporter [Kribbella sp. NPDC026611]|uniref:EamA family transporter n=1 Tax=Kribbella sp. NPDC026611 TaxID=3154911 RepID=UPI0033CBB5FD